MINNILRQTETVISIINIIAGSGTQQMNGWQSGVTSNANVSSNPHNPFFNPTPSGKHMKLILLFGIYLRLMFTSDFRMAFSKCSLYTNV